MLASFLSYFISVAMILSSAETLDFKKVLSLLDFSGFKAFACLGPAFPVLARVISPYSFYFAGLAVLVSVSDLNYIVCLSC